MKDEIKEILNGLNVVIKHGGSVEINSKECKKIIDYITNLQQENERLNNVIDKAIEYIKENDYIDLNGYDLLKILGGGE